MAQRFQPMSGVVVADASTAARVTMSALDSAIAAIPNLVHDLDVSRLVSLGAGLLGRARASGAKLSGQGPGYALVNSSYLNNKPALRLDGTTGHFLKLLRGLASPSFTVAIIGTLAPAIRDSIPASGKNLFTIYDGSNVQVWARVNSGTGNMNFSIGTAGGASVPRASTPASNVGTIMSFARNNSDGTMTIAYNGVTANAQTDADVPVLGSEKGISIGAGSGASTTVTWSGDIARVVAWHRDVPLNYPELWADFIAAAKGEFAIA